MTEETENLVLEHLRAIRAVLSKHSELLTDINLRLGAVEQHLAGFQLSEVRQNAELDRLDRIERRLELTDGQ